ncbi:hypothetical protein D3C84_667780 [compost metagenome]
MPPSQSARALCQPAGEAVRQPQAPSPRGWLGLRIPRQDLAGATQSPDACSRCHDDQSPAWAAKAIEGWFGQPQRSPHYGENFHAVRQGRGDSLVLLSGVIADLGKPAIVRVTAAEQMADLGAPALAAPGPGPSG